MLNLNLEIELFDFPIQNNFINFTFGGDSEDFGISFEFEWQEYEQEVSDNARIETVKSYFTITKTHVEFDVFDELISNVHVKVIGSGSSWTFDDDYSISHHYEKTLSISPDEYLWEYTVEVVAKDKVGNELRVEQKTDGKFLGALKGIYTFFKKAWDTAVDLVNSALEWIKNWILDMVNRMINDFLKPIVDGIENFIESVINLINQAINSWSAEDTASAIANLILGSNIFMLIMGGIVSAQVIFTATKATGIGALIELVVGSIKDLIVGIIIGSLVAQLVLDITDPEKFKDAIPLEVNAGISTTFSLMNVILAFGVGSASLIRELKSAAKFTFVSLGIFLMSILLETGRLIAIKEQTKKGYLTAVVIDAIACGLTLYAHKEVKPHQSLAKTWYPALGMLDDAFGIISIGLSFTTLGSDINGWINT